MFMHRLAVADVADPDQPRMLLCTQEPRSATRGYSCARSLIPGLLIWICFVILLSFTWPPARRRGDRSTSFRAALSERDASSHRFQSEQHFPKATRGRARIPKTSRNRLIIIR